MNDAYLPLLADFEFTEEESAIIAAALKTRDPWNYTPPNKKGNEALKSAKNRIRDYHLKRHSGTCCYCRMDLKNAGPYIIDREHVLPKSNKIYRALSYTMWNLAASCKRCNMQFKKASDKFVVEKDDTEKLKCSGNYLLIHPNFDRWENHLSRISVQINASSIVTFTCTAGSHKGSYTKEFFHLHNYMIDTFDGAQGRENQAEDNDAVRKLHELAIQFGQ